MSAPSIALQQQVPTNVSAGDAAAEFVEKYGRKGDCVGWWSDGRQVAPIRYSGTVQDVPEGSPRLADGANPYQMRLFNPSAELRWEDRPGEGRMHWIREAGAAPDGWVEREPEYPRLLWGTVTATLEAGWCTVFEHRVGELDVPVTEPELLPLGSRLALYAVEYEIVDEHGNVSVVGERLTRIGPWYKEEDATNG